MFIGQNGPVLRGEDFVRQAIERVAGDGFVFLGAENEADGRIFLRARPMFARIIEIHVHLAGIGVGEPAALEIDDDEAAELAMKEQQIDAIPFVADPETALASNESKIAAQLQKKPLQMQDERFFNVGLGVFVLESEELEHVWVFDLFFGRERVFRLCRSTFGEHLRFIPGKSGALVEERIDLAIELPHAPAAAQRFGLVKLSRLFAFHREQPDVGRPWEKKPRGRLRQFRRQRLRFCRRNKQTSLSLRFRRRRLRNWPTQIKEPHLLEIALGKTASVARTEVAGELFDQLRPVFRTDFSFLFKFDDVTPNQPVRLGHQRVDGSRGNASRLVDQSHDTLEHRIVITRAKRKRACLGGYHDPPPVVAIRSGCRRRRLRNSPDAVWIFDCDNSIDGAERIAAASQRMRAA